MNDKNKKTAPIFLGKPLGPILVSTRIRGDHKNKTPIRDMLFLLSVLFTITQSEIQRSIQEIYCPIL
jgi:hypothetical protein